MQTTDIEWTTFSANPLKYRRKSDGQVVWACVKTSPGCARCYAEATALRWDRGKLFTASNMEEVEPFLDEKELREMLTRRTCQMVKVSGSRVFVGDMTDLFGEWVPDELLDRLFAVFALRSDVTWQVLTKRAERMRDYSINPGRLAKISEASRELCPRNPGPDPMRQPSAFWPVPNCWLGVSIENGSALAQRHRALQDCPAAVRFWSVEPLLEGVGNVSAYLPDWVIIGGESGHGSRPCNVEWIQSIVQQCKDAGVACFVKQLGSNVEARNDNVLEWFDRLGYLQLGETERHQGAVGRVSGFSDRKGGDPAEWPRDLRVREFPNGVYV